MGHTLLGRLSRTREWRKVVEFIAAGADVAKVAEVTIQAAEAAFTFVRDDPGYNQAVWLMTRLALAASEADPLAYMRVHGVNIPENTSVAGIAVALTDALDRDAASSRNRSDLGQLAQKALVGAVVQRLQPKVQQRVLFSMQPYDTRRALSEFRKPSEFGQLARTFYARLTSETLHYFLSRILATQVGAGHRFTTMNQLAQFEEALTLHCREASVIVEKFSNEWFSKHRFMENGDISRESVQGFASYSLKKVNDELRAGAPSNAA